MSKLVRHVTHSITLGIRLVVGPRFRDVWDKGQLGNSNAQLLH